MKFLTIVLYLIAVVETENGIWLSRKWVEKKPSLEKVEQLSALLDRYSIKYTFFKAGRTKSDGTIVFNTDNIKRFVALMKNLNSERLLLLWTGGTLPDFKYNDKKFLKNFLSSLEKVLPYVDGIHIDVEPLSRAKSDIEDFLHALKNTEKTKFLSCALPLVGHRNFPSYITSIAMLYPFFVYCEQVVVMGYDTGEYSAETYITLLVEQVKTYLDGILRTSSSAHLLLGLPTYDEVTPYHNPKVENISNGLKGFIKARDSVPFASIKMRGISIYAEWTTNPQEWLIIDKFLSPQD